MGVVNNIFVNWGGGEWVWSVQDERGGANLWAQRKIVGILLVLQSGIDCFCQLEEKQVNNNVFSSLHFTGIIVMRGRGGAEGQ